MYKSVHTDIKKIGLDADLYAMHKHGRGQSEFGMDNTSALLENGFGLYSTVDIKKNIGPIKTEYYRISLTRQGNAHFDIGLEKHQPFRNFILFGIPGQIFSLHDFSDDFLAYYMLFSDKFISDKVLTSNKKEHFPFLTYSGQQCFELSEDTANEIETTIFMMNDEIKKNKSDYAEVIRIYIHLIFILASREYDSTIMKMADTSDIVRKLFDSYLKLVSQHFLSVRKVSDYAEMLHVSPDHLNRAIKACSDKTAHDMIDEMVLMEAKNYLLHTSMSVSEIAYTLDFSDPSHFSRFFKKLNAQTPLEFRKKS